MIKWPFVFIKLKKKFKNGKGKICKNSHFIAFFLVQTQFYFSYFTNNILILISTNLKRFVISAQTMGSHSSSKEKSDSKRNVNGSG